MSDHANEYLENLELVLTSPRKRAPGTLRSYLSTARGFLGWLGEGKIPPTDKDLRRFFMEKEKAGILTSSRSIYFAQLKKLFDANEWTWPFKKEDRPISEDIPTAPALTEEEVLKLIATRAQFTKMENFYLAMAVTYGLRSEELTRITSKDIKDMASVFIKTAKHGQQKTQLLPPEIMPIIEAYKPKVHSTRALRYAFHRMAEKAGIELRPRSNFHSIRRTLLTLLIRNLAKADEDITYAAQYLRWSRKTIGATFLGTPMAGVYMHPEARTNDIFEVDRVCQREDIHPFLNAYRKEVNHNGESEQQNGSEPGQKGDDEEVQS